MGKVYKRNLVYYFEHLKIVAATLPFRHQFSIFQPKEKSRVIRFIHENKMVAQLHEEEL